MKDIIDELIDELSETGLLISAHTSDRDSVRDVIETWYEKHAVDREDMLAWLKGWVSAYDPQFFPPGNEKEEWIKGALHVLRCAIGRLTGGE